MRAGFAKTVITPPIPLQLAGFGVERRGVAVADELSARALVCESGGRRVALLTCDLLWLERRHLRVIRALVTELTGLAPDDVMVACSHTHSGPDTMDWFHFAPVDPQWLHTLLTQLAGCVFQAAESLQPARLETLRGAVTIGMNRRASSERGGITMAMNPDGPVDQTLTALRVVGDDGSLLGSVVQHATHPVILGGRSTVISADWPGEMCRVVERTVGGTCLFVNGAAGDINPRAGVGRPYAEVLRVGRQAGGAAVELLSRDPSEPDSAIDSVDAAAMHFEVPHQPHPYLDIPYERRLAEDGGLWLEAQALRLGPLTFVSAPGECLIETGQRILARTRNQSALIAGYGNDYVGYLALPHIYEQGGYEPGATMLPATAVLAWVDRAVEVADAVA